MTKKQMEQVLSQAIRSGSCWNDVAFRFVNVILVEHLGIDPNSIDPEDPETNRRLNNPLLPVKLFRYRNGVPKRGGRYLNQ